jgi:NAD(P)H-dependent flavin oxidoreductase YrpB (nitropropane dioxygenase family)
MALRTAVTDLFGIDHPVILAGMNVAAGPKLCAAVSNAGGLGVFGGVNFTPAILADQIDEVKALLEPGKKFGVDLLLPKVGEGARKTNYDYTHGKLDELIDIVIAKGASLFVAAVGVPPRAVVDKLHKAGILVMNMIGSPKHVAPALAAGVDLICAQGGEGGGHTGEVATSILIPAVVDAVRGKKSLLTGKQVMVVAAGGIFDGRGLAMGLTLGADAVWVGTRFVASAEAGASKVHKNVIVKSTVHDTMRTLIFTGRPLRIQKNRYAETWETRQDEMKALLANGKLPYYQDMEKMEEEGLDKEAYAKKVGLNMKGLGTQSNDAYPHLMGQCAGMIHDVKPAKEILDSMVTDATAILKRTASMARL